MGSRTRHWWNLNKTTLLYNSTCLLSISFRTGGRPDLHSAAHLHHVFDPISVHFLYGVRWGSNFVVLPVAIQLLQHHVERLFFLHRMILAPVPWIRWPWMLGLFLNSKLYFLDLYVYRYDDTNCISLSIFLSYVCTMLSRLLLLGSKFGNQEVWAILLSFFPELFWLFWVPCNSYEF